MEASEKLYEHQLWVKEHTPELQRAQARIGSAPADVARWILDRFYERNLSDLSAGGRLDLQWETWVFARGTNPTYREGGMDTPLPESVDLEGFQKIVTDVVNTSLTPATVISFEYKSFTELFGVVPGYGAKIIPGFADEVELYQHKIIHNFLPFADKLTRCAACNRVFHKRQENQNYCSVRCQNRIAAREYRKQSKASPKTKGASHGKKR